MMHKQEPSIVSIAFTGDVMIGRLVNKALLSVPLEYPWGNVLPHLLKADLRVMNLETTLTKSSHKVSKVFNFKSDPKNVEVLNKAAVDVVTVANNHILDYADEGLVETLEVLDAAGILHVGAGENAQEARKPAVISKKGMTLGVLGYTDNEPDWIATPNKPRINYIPIRKHDDIDTDIAKLRERVDILIVSLHWGPNMRERPPDSFISFAHHLIEQGVAIVHGHSAHIFQGMEIYKGGIILYDTGDFVDDYAVDPYLRNDRSFLFFVDVDKKGCRAVRLIPTLISEFQVNKSQGIDAEQTNKRMQRLSLEFGTELCLEENMLKMIL